MREVIFIKYGGSIITDKSEKETVNEDVISNLNNQICKLHQLFPSYLFVIGNGGGAFGHYYASKYELYNKKINSNTFFGICEGKNGNNYLNHIVTNDLISKLIPACSINIGLPYLLSVSDLIYAWKEVVVCLDNDVIPVIYGDILILNKNCYTIASTEQAFLFLAKYMTENNKHDYHLNKVILCTNTDGVLNSNGETIPIISNNKDNEIFWDDYDNYDVTGGMREKVSKSLDLSIYAPVQIINGKTDNSIIKAMIDESGGTLIMK